MLAPMSAARLLVLAALWLAACGTRSDYELQYLRELVARGQLQPALEQFERLTPDQRARPATRQLVLGVRLQALGFSPEDVGPMLRRALTNPARAYARLAPGAYPEEPLRALVPEGWGGAGKRADPRTTPPDFNLAKGAAAFLGGLALTRNGAPDGPAIVLDSLEFLAAADGALVPGLAGLAQALLADLDRARGTGSREAALLDRLTEELEP